MARMPLTVAVAVMLLASVFVFGSSAYTTATLDRSASIEVVNDASGLIGLNANGGSALVDMANGKLNIDFSTTSASGINTEAKILIGSTTSPDITNAFTIANNADAQKDVKVTYSNFPTTNGKNLRFLIYGTVSGSIQKLDELNQNDQSVTLDMVAGEEVYVVMIINTGHGGVSTVDETKDLSGTLTVSAS